MSPTYNKVNHHTTAKSHYLKEMLHFLTLLSDEAGAAENGNVMHLILQLSRKETGVKLVIN